jgi:hypothetical protein
MAELTDRPKALHMLLLRSCQSDGSAGCVKVVPIHFF